MTYGKRTLRNEDDWNKWLIQAFENIFGVEEPAAREEMKLNHPSSFPVIVVWKATKDRVDWFYFSMIYPKEFSGALRPRRDMKTKTIELNKQERMVLLSLINRAEIDRDRKIMDAQGVPDRKRKLPPLSSAAFRTLELIEAKLLDEVGIDSKLKGGA